MRSTVSLTQLFRVRHRENEIVCEFCTRLDSKNSKSDERRFWKEKTAVFLWTRFLIIRIVRKPKTGTYEDFVWKRKWINKCTANTASTYYKRENYWIIKYCVSFGFDTLTERIFLAHSSYIMNRVSSLNVSVPECEKPPIREIKIFR